MLLKTEDNTTNYVYIHLFFASVLHAYMYACTCVWIHVHNLYVEGRDWHISPSIILYFIY